MLRQALRLKVKPDLLHQWTDLNNEWMQRVGKSDSEMKSKIWFLYYFKSDLKTRIKVRSDPNTIKYFQIKCAEVLKIFLYGMLIFWFCHYCLIWYRMMITMIILQMDGMGTTNTWSWKMWLLTSAGLLSPQSS